MTLEFAAPDRSVSFLETLRIQLRVIGALTLREMGGRFGRDNLGYVWLFIEPALLGGAIGLLHHLGGHSLPGGPNVFVFWVMGYIPYYLFRGIVNRAPSAIVGNQSLLYHRRITLLDILLSRNLLEGGAVLGAAVAFTLFFGIFMGEWPSEPHLMIVGFALMLGLSHGLALLLAAGSVYTELIDRVVHLATYIAIPATGAFFMVFWLPTELQRLALMVPTVHCFELVRAGQFGSLLPTHYDVAYVVAWILVTNMLGMAALRVARRKLVL